MRFDPIHAIEACYAGAGTEEAWLGALVEAFEPLSCGLGVMALRLDLGARGIRAGRPVLRGPVPFAGEPTLAPWKAAPPEVVDAWFTPVPVVETGRQRLRRLSAAGPAFTSPFQAHEAAGVYDVLTLLAREPGGACVLVTVPSGRPIRHGPRALHRLSRVAAHLGTAARLRARVEPGVEAVLDPSGAVHHATGPARDPRARESLAAAVMRAERARGRLRRSDPDEALELWRGLVEGRWSLVEHVEADGRRLLLARRNPPGAPDPKALTPRERDVLAYAVQGHSSKYVAYALGLSGATIASHLKGALAKLGVRSRAGAVSLLSGKAAAPARRAGEEAA